MRGNDLLKFVFFISFISFPFNSIGQRIQYGGIYALDTPGGQDESGLLYVHQESDSLSLFYLELNIGSPSFNSGAFIGLMHFYDDSKAIFTIKSDTSDINCIINFQFSKDKVYVRPDVTADECGFGHGVYAFGDFYCIDHVVPDSFINQIGEKVNFENLNWLDWW